MGTWLTKVYYLNKFVSSSTSFYGGDVESDPIGGGVLVWVLRKLS